MSLVSLTTDFGLEDPYVGMMKAVILGLAPRATLVDLCHRIGAQDLRHGALVLWASMDVFTAGATHVVVVDPGVGSERRAVMVEAGGQRFIGPDNGVMWPAITRCPDWRAVALEEPMYQRTTVSATFHGRDIFAPAAGHAVAGVPLEAFGPPVDALQELHLFDAQQTPGRVCGRVLYFDHFGNAITNIAEADLQGQMPTGICLGSASHSPGQSMRMIPWCRTFSDVSRGATLGFMDSFGLVEIAVREGSARELLSLERDCEVEVLFG